MQYKTFIKCMAIIDASTKFTHSVGEDTLKAMFIVLENDFEDREFMDICLKYLKTNTDFPATADFYKIKAKPHIPECAVLFDGFCSLLSGSRDETRNYAWMLEVRKYFSGKTPANYRERTMEEMSWLEKDWAKAYDRFLSDYESGHAIRIDFSHLPEISNHEPIEHKGPLKLNSLLKNVL